jgi:hypothetical protein
MALTPGQVSGMLNAAVVFSILPALNSQLIDCPCYARSGACRGYGGSFEH